MAERLLARLAGAGLFRPRTAPYLAAALACEGVNLAALARFAAWRHRSALAVADGQVRLDYGALWTRAQSLAAAVAAETKVQPGQGVGLVCRSHAGLACALFAVARLKATAWLISPDLGAGQLEALAERQGLALLIHDPDLSAPPDPRIWLSCPIGDGLLLASRIERGEPALGRPGGIVVMTSGSTGAPKPARREARPARFLAMSAHLLTTLELDRFGAAYVATPLHHGFGLAGLLLGVALGKTVHLRPRFHAAEACALVAREKVEVLALAPTMLQRMLAHDAGQLASVARVLCGGAPLSPGLAEAALERLGNTLFNLYGASETGFCVMATPAELRGAPDTIGREIPGVQLALLDADGRPVAEGETGRLCVDSPASVRAGGWIDTGDLARRDLHGLLFLRGRSDEMIVSGGENVYPVELEAVLARHADVEATAVVGVPDEEFGQRLKAFVVLRPGCGLAAADLHAWLAGRLARHQKPREIEIRSELPVTAVGKIDKRKLARSDGTPESAPYS